MDKFRDYISVCPIRIQILEKRNNIFTRRKRFKWGTSKRSVILLNLYMEFWSSLYVHRFEEFLRDKAIWRSNKTLVWMGEVCFCLHILKFKTRQGVSMWTTTHKTNLSRVTLEEQKLSYQRFKHRKKADKTLSSLQELVSTEIMANSPKKNFKSFRIDDILQPDEYKGLATDMTSSPMSSDGGNGSPPLHRRAVEACIQLQGK